MAGNPVHEEKGPGDGVGLEHALDQSGRGARFARTGRHFHKELAPALPYLLAERVNTILLIIASGNVRVDRHGKDLAALGAWQNASRGLFV